MRTSAYAEESTMTTGGSVRKIIIAALVVAGCVIPAAAGQAYSVYSNTKYKVSFRYAKGWVVQPAALAAEKVTFDRNGDVRDIEITAGSGDTEWMEVDGSDDDSFARPPKADPKEIASADSVFISRDGRSNPSVTLTVRDNVRRTEAQMIGEMIHNPLAGKRTMKREDVLVARKKGMTVVSLKARQTKSPYLFGGSVYIAPVVCYLTNGRQIKLAVMDNRQISDETLNAVLGSLTVNGVPALGQ
jgi:hypothetical protein